MKTNWPTKKLGEICYITDGSHFSPSTIDTGYPYITVSDVSWSGEIDFTNCKFISKESYNELVKNGCKPRKGDVLFSKDGTVGKVAVVNTDKEFVVLSSLAILRPSKDVNPSFLFWAMQSPDFLAYAIGSKTGAALKRVVLRIIKTFEIPVPTVGEQKKIVAKIEKQFAKIDEAARLRAESEAATAALLPAALHEIFSQSESKGWEEKTLGEATEVVGGGTPSTSRNEYWGGSHVWVTPKDLGKLDSVYLNDSAKHISDSGLKNSSAKLLPTGSVLFSSRAPIGYVAINNVPVSTNQGCRSFVCLEHLVNKFLYYFLIYKREYIQSIGSGSTFAEIAGSKLKLIKIPLPPLAEQKKIVKKLDALSEKVRALRELQLAQSADLKALKQSILHEAFAGNL